MSEVTMPRLSDTMEEGELARWLKNVGDQVEKGDVIAEIETDKATMDLEAFESGVLEKQLVEEGTVVPIGQAVAMIGDGSGSSDAKPEADAPAEDAEEQKDTAAQEDTVAAAAESETASDELDEDDLEESEEPGQPAESGQAEAAPAASSGTGGEASAGADKLRMSPLARKLARDNEIDLDSLSGTGPDGRIIRADVEAAIEGKGAKQADSPAAPKTPAADDGDSEVIPLNRIRKVTAKRLTESQSVPHFFLTNVVDVDKLVALRADVNRGLAEQGVKVSLNDFIIKAVAIALRLHPEANASFNGDSILQHHRVNVGVAVATDAGLLVPVVTDADRKSLSEIGANVVELARLARDGKLKLDQMSGGTFSVSNLGMFGIDEFTAMLNPPEAGILAVGAASPVPMLRDGELVEVQKMKITLTVDHRAMDGATGAAFLRDLKGILEEPLRILV